MPPYLPSHLPSYPAHASTLAFLPSPCLISLHTNQPHNPPTPLPPYYPLTLPLPPPPRVRAPPTSTPPPPKAYEAIQQYAGEAGVIASVDRLYQAAMMLQAEGHTPLLSRAQAAQMLGAPPSRQNAHKSLDMGATTVLAIAGVATVGIGALVRRARRWERPPPSPTLSFSLSSQLLPVTARPVFTGPPTHALFFRTPRRVDTDELLHTVRADALYGKAL